MTPTDGLAPMGERTKPTVVPFSRDPNEKLIEFLKECLAQAESGEINGMVGVKLRPDSTFATFRTGDCSDLELVGALYFSMQDIVTHNNPRPES
jgi:hypothetical protein